MTTSEPGMATAGAILKLGGPPLLAEWLYRSGLDGAAALHACPRADWLVWLAAVDGAADEQLLGAGIAAVRTVLPLLSDAAWPLGAALDAVDGQPGARVPTAAELAFAIAGSEGVEQRVALAVRSVCRAVVSHRVIAVRILATVVANAAVAAAQVRHAELAALSTPEARAFVDNAWRSRGEPRTSDAPLPLGVIAVLRQLRALVPTVRPRLEHVGVSRGEHA